MASPFTDLEVLTVLFSLLVFSLFTAAGIYNEKITSHSGTVCKLLYTVCLLGVEIRQHVCAVKGSLLRDAQKVKVICLHENVSTAMKNSSSIFDTLKDVFSVESCLCD